MLFVARVDGDVPDDLSFFDAYDIDCAHVSASLADCIGYLRKFADAVFDFGPHGDTVTRTGDTKHSFNLPLYKDKLLLCVYSISIFPNSQRTVLINFRPVTGASLILRYYSKKIHICGP